SVSLTETVGSSGSVVIRVLLEGSFNKNGSAILAKLRRHFHRRNSLVRPKTTPLRWSRSVRPAVPAMSHLTPPPRICIPRRTWLRDSVPGLGRGRGFFHPFHSEARLILVLIGSTPARPYVNTSCWARTDTVSVRIPTPTLLNTKARPALLPTKRLPKTFVE